MRITLGALLLATLSGCVVSNGIVRSEAVSFDDTIEDTTDKLLVLNILRAKDKAPLHFEEIPSIHESIQENGSAQALFPFGVPNSKYTARNTGTTGVSIQVSPSFEIDHLDTKDFVTGMASPIDTKFVKYWLDRGLDRRIALLLFFSAADLTLTTVGSDGKSSRSTIRVRNSPRDAIAFFDKQANQGGTDTEARCQAQTEFQHYLKFIDSLKTFAARSVTSPPRVLATGLHPETDAKDLEVITGLDPTKYKWQRNSGNDVSIYQISTEPQIILCFLNSPIKAGSSSSVPTAACRGRTAENPASDEQTDDSQSLPVPWSDASEVRRGYCGQFNQFITLISGTSEQGDLKPELRLEIRSVGEIIQFLGDLVEYQEELRQFRQVHPEISLKLNNPVTFAYCADEKGGPTAGCADRFFDLRNEACNSRFSVAYRGRRYYIANFNRSVDFASDLCTADSKPIPGIPLPIDHSLEVLAVVHQMIDLQKSAQDIRETPYVQLLP